MPWHGTWARAVELQMTARSDSPMDRLHVETSAGRIQNKSNADANSTSIGGATIHVVSPACCLE
jgi:hypothetical protein